jgi:aminopeptidase N
VKPDQDFGATSADDPYIPDSGNGGYRISRYELELNYRMSSNRLTGKAKLAAVTTQTLSRLSLDLVGLQVSKVSVNGRRVARFNTRSGKLFIWLDKPIPVRAGLAIEVRYAGNPIPRFGPWGDVGWEELADGVIVAGQPNGAPTWFPCNDHPSEKASYLISVTTDSPYRVVSNGRLVGQTKRASQTTWTYDQPEPMASYLATVQIGQYEHVSLSDWKSSLPDGSSPDGSLPDGSLPDGSSSDGSLSDEQSLTHGVSSSDGVVDQQAVLARRVRDLFAHDFGRQPQMMTAFSRLFGPYPYPGYTVVITDDDLEIPLEAQGISVFGANYLDGRRGQERLVAHELAHQWFGNSLTIDAWQHIWLNEGFACYAEWLWSEESGAASADQLARETWDRLDELPQDLVIAAPGARSMFDDRLYKRGALTLHALRSALDDEMFFDMLRDWTARHRHGNVNTELFMTHAGRFREQSLAGLFNAWLFESALPPL